MFEKQKIQTKENFKKWLLEKGQVQEQVQEHYLFYLIIKSLKIQWSQGKNQITVFQGINEGER